MSVNPGFGGQHFIPRALDKVRELDRLRRERHLQLPIEIDGGITLENLQEVIRAGCDWVVTGSSVFHSPDPAATVAAMRQVARDATEVQV
jgi:ribulose-phosphate 3-epimerase